MRDNEDDFTARERRILRGMIDEYESNRLRNAWWRAIFADTKATLAFLVVATLLILQVTQIIITMQTLRGK